MRHRILADVNLVLRSADRLLLLRRAGTGWMDGHYALIAGHLEAGETFRQAMAREAREEAGLRIDVEDLALALTMHRRSDEDRLSLFFTARRWSGEPMNVEPDKCDDMRWFSAGEMPVNLVGYVTAGLAAIARGETSTEFSGF